MGSRGRDAVDEAQPSAHRAHPAGGRARPRLAGGHHVAIGFLTHSGPLTRRTISPASPWRGRAELAAPTLVAAVLAAVYVIVSPPSLDLAAHLFRARLFEQEGFGIWNNFWYSGHDIPGYSVFFPAVSAAITPQLAGALAAVATTGPFTALAWRHRGRAALPGTLLFGAFTAVDLYTGRLPFAFGALPAVSAVLALDCGWWPLACGLAAVSALCSPVAALFTAIVAGGYALGAVWRARPAATWPERGVAGTATAVCALAPVLVLTVVFPEGGTEPFTIGSMLPVLAVAVVGWACVDRQLATLRACLIVYAAAVLVTFAVPTAIGSNVARMGTLLAAPLTVVVLWKRRPRLLAAAIVPLLYIGVQAPIQNVVVSSGKSSTSVAFYAPLLGYLRSRPGQPFRIEIPFTALHWEAYRVATHIPITRGWERQLDERDNPIFYRRGALTPASYAAWLHDNAVRFVALPDAPLDSSARGEAALIRGGLPYLRAPVRVGAWRIYAVADATPIAQGPATLTALGPDWFTLHVRRPGVVFVHVRWSPYWSIVRGSGCVAPDGQFTRVIVRTAGSVRLDTRFAIDRIDARSSRCTHTTSMRRM
jgi:hypothetical protein